MLDFSESKEQSNNFKDIYEQYDELDIYFRVLGCWPDVRTKLHSPFSKDSNPSFSFRQTSTKLLWHCFSNDLGGDAVALVAQIHNLDYGQACQFIRNNYPSSSNIQKTTREPSKPAKIEVVLFDKDPESFYDYWSSFCISKQTLELYNIRAAKEVWLNDKLYSVYSDKSPVIRYLINGKYKIYRPYGKSDKWISNTRLIDPQGWKQLPEKGNLLIVGKAMKDILVFHELGINAIALCSESCNIPLEMYENLSKRFKKIITFLDNDESGFRAMIKIYNSYQIEHYWVPIELECKDIAEFADNYGLEGTSELLERLNIR